MPPKEKEPFEEEIAREMTVKPLDIEEIWNLKGRITEDQMKGLTEANKGIMFANALLEERQYACLKVLEKLFEHLMHIEANQIRNKHATAETLEAIKTSVEAINQDRKKITGWALIVRWAVRIIVGSALVGLIGKGLNRLWK